MATIEELTARIEELERKISDSERQQITFPLDKQSIEILNKYFMRIKKDVVTVGGVGGNTFFEYIGNQDDKEFVVSKNPYIPYTVDPSTDILTIVGARFQNDVLVYVSTEDTAPAGLTANSTYYIVNASADGTSFKLSATLGGSAINITSTGTGRQYISYL